MSAPRSVALVVALALGGCKRATPSVGAPLASEAIRERAGLRAASREGLSEARALQRCYPEDASGDPPRPIEALLDRAAERYDRSDFASSLACAEEGARVDPRSVEAHHDRAAALQELGRLDEARGAFTRALALDPDDPETLAAAADLYINRLLPSNDHTETGLEYARHGLQRLRRNRLRPAAEARRLGAWLSLLEGQALNDLGRSREALARLDAAVAGAPDDVHARYERAVALFDLCRFADARRGLDEVLARSPNNAWAHHHLGLVLERLGDPTAAERELSQARSAAPNDFKPPVELEPTEFRRLVHSEAQKLRAELRADLAKVKLETTDLPALEDLTAEEPPLAPTILGLFRGAPLGEAPESEPRSIILYRKNLARAVASHDELVAQIRTTLLHELGHLRGEDDDALRARGLE